MSLTWAGASTRLTSTNKNASTCIMFEYEYECSIFIWVWVRILVCEYDHEYRTMFDHIGSFISVYLLRKETMLRLFYNSNHTIFLNYFFVNTSCMTILYYLVQRSVEWWHFDFPRKIHCTKMSGKYGNQISPKDFRHWSEFDWENLLGRLIAINI